MTQLASSPNPRKYSVLHVYSGFLLILDNIVFWAEGKMESLLMKMSDEFADWSFCTQVVYDCGIQCGRMKSCQMVER